MNELLEKYWEGQTSLQEEQQLRDYFASDQVLPQHELYRPLFAALVVESSSEVDDFDAFAKVNTQQTQEKIVNSKTWKGIVAAASISLLVALGAGYFNQPSQQDLGTYEDPQEAYEATLAALELVGTKFNKGRNNLQPLTQINKQTTQVFKINP